MADEIEMTYKWILKTFLDSMNNRGPIQFLQNGDNAMSKAIKIVDVSYKNGDS